MKYMYTYKQKMEYYYKKFKKIKEELNCTPNNQKEKVNLYSLDTEQAQYLLELGEDTEALNDESICEAMDIIVCTINSIELKDESKYIYEISLIKEIVEEIKKVFYKIPILTSSQFDENYQIAEEIYITNIDAFWLIKLHTLCKILKEIMLCIEMCRINLAEKIDNIGTYTGLIVIETEEILRDLINKRGEKY